MTTVRWAPGAANDLEAIHDFIARDSPRYARLVCERILGRIEHLEQFPLSGRVVPELGVANLREVVIPPFRIVYRIRGANVEIVTVFQAARLFPTGR